LNNYHILEELENNECHHIEDDIKYSKDQYLAKFVSLEDYHIETVQNEEIYFANVLELNDSNELYLEDDPTFTVDPNSSLIPQATEIVNKFNNHDFNIEFEYILES
jgi:5-methylthioribose kinase